MRFALLAFAVASLFQASSEPWRVADESGAEISVEAVCSVDSTGTKCWTPERAPAPQVAVELDAALKHSPLVSFDFRYVNRYVVVRTSMKSGRNSLSVPYREDTVRQVANLQSPPAANGWWVSRNVYWVKVTPGEGDFKVPVQCRSSKPLEFKLKGEASTSTVEGKSLKCASIIPATDRDMNYVRFPSGKFWRVEVKSQGISPGSECAATVLDASGAPVAALDSAGHPATLKDAQLAQARRDLLYAAGEPSPQIPFEWPNTTVTRDGDTLVVFTNVDVRSAVVLDLTVYEYSEASMQGLPVNPR